MFKHSSSHRLPNVALRKAQAHAHCDQRSRQRPSKAYKCAWAREDTPALPRIAVGQQCPESICMCTGFSGSVPISSSLTTSRVVPTTPCPVGTNINITMDQCCTLPHSHAFETTLFASASMVTSQHVASICRPSMRQPRVPKSAREPIDATIRWTKQHWTNDGHLLRPH